MPIVRRRQRLSSNCTAPAERSPAISIRAMSLRNSTGKSNCASVSRSFAPKAKAVSPSVRPLRSSARNAPAAGASALARKTFTLSAPAALSVAVSARGPAMPPETMVISRVSSIGASVLTKSAPRPSSMPSASHTSSTSRVWSRKRLIAGTASVRSTVCGFGLIWCSRTRADAAVAREISRGPSDSGMSATARWSFSARAMISSAVRSRPSHAAAAGQPSSIRIATGARAFVAATGGFHSGPAAAKMTSAASASRINVSHHGVRAGVSSLGTISRRSRVGGKSMRRGRGGMSRKSHHSTGSVRSPISTTGSARPSGSPPIMPAPAGGQRPANENRRPPDRRQCGRAAPEGARRAGGRYGG